MISPKSRILVAEDSEITSRVIKSALAKLGYHKVDVFPNGIEAWKALVEQNEADPYCLIISDWQMPEMNGLQLLKKIRDYEETSQMPFIMLTGVAEKEQVFEAIRAGASAYIAKPFTLQLLEGKLFEIVSSATLDAAGSTQN